MDCDELIDELLEQQGTEGDPPAATTDAVVVADPQQEEPVQQHRERLAAMTAMTKPLGSAALQLYAGWRPSLPKTSQGLSLTSRATRLSDTRFSVLPAESRCRGQRSGCSRPPGDQRLEVGVAEADGIAVPAVEVLNVEAEEIASEPEAGRLREVGTVRQEIMDDLSVGLTAHPLQVGDIVAVA